MTTDAERALQHALALREAAARDAAGPKRWWPDGVVAAAAIVLADGDIVLRDPATGRDVDHALLAAMLAYAHGRSAWREYYTLDLALGDPEGVLAALPVMTRDAIPGLANWKVHGVPSRPSRSSGTSAVPVRYPIWTGAITAIEVWHHYRTVLVEHGIDPTQRVAVVRAAPMGRDPGESSPPRARYLRSHGADRAVVHCHRYRPGGDSDAFCAGLADACRACGCDVLIINGSTIALVADWIRRNSASGSSCGEACRLVSATFEATDPRDVATLVESGFAAAVCNHMRCWDGGVTFLSCRHGRTHLLEHLVHAEVLDGRLVTTDPFSLAAPFVRYWAGDQAVLGAEAELCECGRWSRPFAFAGRTPFLLTIVPGRVITSIELYDILTARLDVPFQAACGLNTIRVTTPYPVPSEAQTSVVTALGGLAVTFAVGDFARFGRFGGAPRIYEEEKR